MKEKVVEVKEEEWGKEGRGRQDRDPLKED